MKSRRQREGSESYTGPQDAGPGHYFLLRFGVCIGTAEHTSHTQMRKRDFVLNPLAEIAPYKRHPTYGETVAEMPDSF